MVGPQRKATTNIVGSLNKQKQNKNHQWEPVIKSKFLKMSSNRFYTFGSHPV